MEHMPLWPCCRPHYITQVYDCACFNFYTQEFTDGEEHVLYPYDPVRLCYSNAIVGPRFEMISPTANPTQIICQIENIILKQSYKIIIDSELLGQNIGIRLWFLIQCWLPDKTNLTYYNHSPRSFH